MANKIQIKRGTKANLPALDAGEPALCTDTGEVYVGTNSTTAGNKFINGVGSTSGLVVKTGTNGVFTTGTVDTANIADSAVTSAKIADGTIVAGDLASNAVTTAKITDANVTTAKLAANAVTNAKTATMAAYTLKGNNTNAAAVPQDISASNARMMLKAADVNAFSALYDAQGAVTALGLGVPSTDLSSGSVDVAESLKTSFRTAIGAQAALTFPLQFSLGGSGMSGVQTGTITPNSSVVSSNYSLYNKWGKVRIIKFNFELSASTPVGTTLFTIDSDVPYFTVEMIAHAGTLVNGWFLEHPSASTIIKTNGSTAAEAGWHQALSVLLG